MERTELVVLDAFGTEAEAQLAKGALESIGIDAIILADSVGGMRPHVAWATGGYRLLVREEDVETAREALNSGAEAIPDDGA